MNSEIMTLKLSRMGWDGMGWLHSLYRGELLSHLYFFSLKFFYDHQSIIHLLKKAKHNR